MPRKTSNTGGRRASTGTRAKARTAAKKAVKGASKTSTMTSAVVKTAAKAVAKPKAQKQALSRTMTQSPKPSKAVRRGVTSSSLSATEKKRLAQGEVARATNYVAKTAVSGVAKSPAKAGASVTNTSKKSNARATRKTVNSAVRRKKPY